jgi:hypothetical protein
MRLLFPHDNPGGGQIGWPDLTPHPVCRYTARRAVIRNGIATQFARQGRFRVVADAGQV